MRVLLVCLACLHAVVRPGICLRGQAAAALVPSSLISRISNMQCRTRNPARRQQRRRAVRPQGEPCAADQAAPRPGRRRSGCPLAQAVAGSSYVPRAAAWSQRRCKWQACQPRCAWAAGAGKAAAGTAQLRLVFACLLYQSCSVLLFPVLLPPPTTTTTHTRACPKNLLCQPCWLDFARVPSTLWPFCSCG